MPELDQLGLASGARFPYDYLVLATGATHSYFGHDEWAPYAPGLKTVEDATEIRRRVLLAFELAERQMQEQGWHPPLNFVVIGGGPTGVELAGAISDISQLYMRQDFRHIDPTKSRVLLLDGGPRVLAAYPPDLSARAEKILLDLGVEVHTECQVTNVGAGWVDTAGPKGIGRIDASVTLWAAGVQASPLGKLLGRPHGQTGVRAGRCAAQSAGTAQRLRARRPGPLRAGRAPGSRGSSARHADGRPRRAHDRSRSSTASPVPRSVISTRATWQPLAATPPIAKVEWPFKAHLSGFLAWMTWALVHIFFLIGFRNRLRVMASWFWTYIFFSRGARLITGDPRLPGWHDQVVAGPPEKASPEAETTATRA